MFTALQIVSVVLITAMVEPPSPPKAPQAEFVQIFDGSSLVGWKGDLRFWSIENGCIVGRSTAENPCKVTTYLHHDAVLDDFELTFDIKLEGEGANSGMQYRSTPLGPDVTDGHDLAGYQADFDRSHRYSGILYETRGRGIAVGRGQAIRFNADGSKREIEPARPDAELKQVIIAVDADPKAEGWHSYRVVADGRRLEHWIDGRRVMLAEDHDPRFAGEGILALQVHQGPPMTVRVRNLMVRDLTPSTPIRWTKTVSP